MARFLFCITRDSEAIVPKAYEISHNVEVDDLTWPKNTISFLLVESERKEELLKRFFYLTHGDFFAIPNIEALEVEDHKIYMIGQEVLMDGALSVCNFRNKTFMPNLDFEKLQVVVIPE